MYVKEYVKVVMEDFKQQQGLEFDVNAEALEMVESFTEANIFPYTSITENENVLTYVLRKLNEFKANKLK